MKDSEIINPNFISSMTLKMKYEWDCLWLDKGLAQRTDHVCGFSDSSFLRAPRSFAHAYPITLCFRSSSPVTRLLGNRDSAIFISAFPHLATQGFLNMYIQLNALCK